MGFKLKSKISATKYPCLQTMDEILQWLVFAKSVDPYEIDPVFLGRLGAMAKDENRKHVILSGHRLTSLQEKLYLNAGGVKNSDGTYSDPYGKVNGRVAKPNRSFHEYKLAVDSGDKYYKAINKLESTFTQSKLNKYGLFKPLTIGNGIKESGCEDWHIQPIETYNLDLEGRKKMMPDYITETQLSPYEILQSKSIMSKTGFDWKSSCDKNELIRGDFCKALFTNFYKYKTKKWQFSFTEVLDYFVEQKIISDKSYWVERCITGKKCDGKNVKIVIERMSKLV